MFPDTSSALSQVSQARECLRHWTGIRVDHMHELGVILGSLCLSPCTSAAVIRVPASVSISDESPEL